MKLSNTRFLERHLGWTGLLFEPNPHFHDRIAKTRKSPLVTACVTDRAGQTVQFRVDNGMQGGIVGEGFDNAPSLREAELAEAEIIEVPTTTLMDELDRHNVPALIDYFSLDVEGAEGIVMKNFDYARYKFRFMTVERPPLALALELDRHGYVQLAHETFDVFYTHRDFLDSYTPEPRFYFCETPRKEW